MTPSIPSSDAELAPLSRASGISVRDLTVRYGLRQDVLSGLSLAIEPGEIVALLGASGCGKSTLLRAIAQLLQPTTGSIEFDGGTAGRRAGDLAYVFQDATLLPWRTVAENIRLPLELGRHPRAAGHRRSQLPLVGEPSDDRIDDLLRSVGLGEETRDRFPRELSGGMRMRTSIARALVTDPSVLLLDEPFAALDDLLRSRLNDLVLELWQRRARTILFVTHNIAEAIYLSHRIAVLSGGKVAKTVDNSLPWPRSSQQRTTMEFATLFGQVSSSLAEVAV